MGDVWAKQATVDFGDVTTSVLAGPTDPTKSITGSQTVNLYSGQHVESFPLLSLQGHGGFGFSLSLDYSGNVTQLAKTENRKGQASEVGLGFSLNIPFIASDHRSTTYLWDDTYTLSMRGSLCELKHIDSNQYITDRGEPWLIFRHTTTLGSRDYVTGWTLVDESGRVYVFGDMDSSLIAPNATQTVLHYGDFVGSGVTVGDSLYPFRWNLKKVTDADELNCVEFSYAIDSAYLTIINPSDSNATTTSDHPYSQASYLGLVRTSAGSQATFNYTAREDCQSFFGVNIYEFFQRRKLSSVVIQDRDSSTISQIRLHYKYLNQDRDSTFKKLILTKVTKVDADDSDSLLTYAYDYYNEDTSLAFGRIESIHTVTGAVKTIHYATVQNSVDFAELSREFPLRSPTGVRDLYADNMFIMTDTTPDSYKIYLGYWNGYWAVDTFNLSYYTQYMTAATPYGWAAFYLPNIEKFVVKRWTGGTWRTDTLECPFTLYDGATNLRYYTGSNCFLVTTGNDPSKLRRANFYVWTGTEWYGQDVLSCWGEAQYAWYSVKLGDRSYAICIKDDEGVNSTLTFGKYYPRFEPQTGETRDTVIWETHGWLSNYWIGDRFVVGTDVVAFIYDGNYDPLLYWKRWEDSCWSSSWHSMGANFDGNARAIAPLPNGLVWSFDDGDGGWATLGSVFFSPGGMTEHARYIADTLSPNKTDALWSGYNSLITHYQATNNTNLWMWNGYKWEYTNFVGNEAGYRATLFPDHYVWLDQTWDLIQRRMKARKYLGYMEWSDTVLTSDSLWTYNGASDCLLAGVDGSNIELFDQNRYYYGQSFDLKAINHTGISVQCAVGSDNVIAEWTSPYRTQAYKLMDTLLTGKAPLVVVSRVSVLNGSADTNPIVTDYDYFGGLLDERAVSPRFARVTVSVPHFESDSAEGFVAHCFFNDIDAEDFYDSTIYNSMSFPNLHDTSFGYADAGFHLDGREYCSYSYNDPDSIIDSSYTYYRISIPPTVTSPARDVRRVLVDSAKGWSDGLESFVAYHYDDTTGLRTSTRSKIAESSIYSVDSIVYAYRVNDTVRSDNALALPFRALKFVDSSGTLTCVTRQETYYEKEGSWRPRSAWTWYDAEQTDTTASTAIRTFATMGDTLLSYDDYGNVQNSQNSQRVVASVKYDSAGVRPIAVASNCTSREFLVQDFEQGSGWDDWSCRDFYDHISFDTSAFTGQYSLKVVDAAGTDKNWAAYRFIDATELTDSLYYFSAWVKTNHSVYVYCWCLDSLNQTCTGGYKYKYFDDADLPDGEWTRIEGVFNLSDQIGSVCLNKIKPELVLANGTEGVDYAYFDDFRFHPVKAHISTTVYDPHTGFVVAEAGADNIPVRKEADKFFRTKLVMDELWDTLSVTEYGFSPMVEPPDTLHESLSQVDTIISSVVIDHDQFVSYLLAISTDGHSAEAKGEIRHNGDLIRTIQCYEPEGCNKTKDGSFFANDQDTVTLALHVPSIEYYPVVNAWVYYSTLEATYDTLQPNYTKTTIYPPGRDSVVAISYYDALGRALQTRTTSVDTAGSPQTLVSGVGEYDAQGRVLKAYLPFYDLLDSTAVDEFAPMDQAVAEATYYYDGIHGPDCDSVAYTETRYEAGVKGRVLEQAASGPDHMMGSGHTTSYTYGVDADSGLISTMTQDPDGVITRKINDRWGLFTHQTSLFQDHNLDDSLVVSTYADRYGDSSWVEIDTTGDSTSVDPILLRRTEFDDLGREVESWKVDYGTIRSLHDKGGNLRFMQNEKRRQEGAFVYFKYDALGRKIEEGLVTDSSYWGQSNADLTAFPDTISSFEARYRWYYDVYDTIVAPGRLVRVENSDTSYYQNFYYWPTDHKDLVVTKLPIVGGSLKAVKHEYYPDGALRTVTVYPHYPDSVDARDFYYAYDEAGRPKCVYTYSYGLMVENEDSLNYATWTYNADGSVAKAVLGDWYHTSQTTPVEYDTVTVQKVDYSYNALGALMAINLASEDDSTAVVATAYGGVTDTADNDHFGEWLTYWTGDSTGYFNGRLQRFRSYNSTNTVGTRRARGFNCEVDELNRLEEANAYEGIAHSRLYKLSDMSNRVQLVRSYLEDTVTYVYDSTSPGSSRLLRTSDMGGYRMHHDMLGNLVSDSSRSVFQQDYDYRNLLTYAVVAPTAAGSNSTLDFAYDQGGRRIHKKFHYQYWDDCSGGTIGDSLDFFVGGDTLELGGATMSSGGGGTLQCRYWATTETFYLYDNGVLLCTFDQNDDVDELFVNTPHGTVAEYWKNDDQYLYFFLKDHLGTPRVYMQGPPTDTTVHVGFYANYYPFGELLERGGNIFSDFAFTGKERDVNSSFDYYYFGSRYFDPRIGTFTGVDKAGQFASGYAYGGNNPTMLIDPDGNFAFLAAALFAYQLGHSVHSIYEQRGDMFEALIKSTVMTGIGTVVGEVSQSTDIFGNELLKRNAQSNAMRVLTSRRPIADLGIWSDDFDSGERGFIDFGGPITDKISDFGGLVAFASDYVDYQSMLYNRDTPELQNPREVYEHYAPDAVEGGEALFGWPEERLREGAKGWNSMMSPLDPLSYVNVAVTLFGRMFDSDWNFFGSLNGSRKSRLYHDLFSQRFGTIHVTSNSSKGAFFGHKEIPITCVFPLGLIAHQIEAQNHRPFFYHVIRESYGLYRFNYASQWSF